MWAVRMHGRTRYCTRLRASAQRLPDTMRQLRLTSDAIRFMTDTSRAYLLGPLLKGVSRSFYLTLRILPAGMRDPVGLAYLLARAADTIADTALIAPDARLAWLLSLREQVEGTADPAALARLADALGAHQTQTDERTLLESLPPALALLADSAPADRAAVRALVSTLTQGMEFDLRSFPDERSGRLAALPDDAALDRYTYMVAGCVGEFWTQMTYAHVPRALPPDAQTMIARGIGFGKALQLTNVLRDCAKDLRIGRCYLPADRLAAAGLTPEALLEPGASARARPVLNALLRLALARYREGLDYACAIRPGFVRLRLACIWPIVIGLETLRLLAASDAWLDPAHSSKIRRADVYRIVARSLPAALSNRALRRWCEPLFSDIETQLARRETAG